MHTYIIGRSRFADIVLADASVDRRHAELVVTGDGRHHLTDCGGDGGTWRRRPAAERDSIAVAPAARAATGSGKGWEAVRQAFVDPAEPLRLGAVECTTAALLRQIDADHASGGGGDGGGRWRPGLAATGQPRPMRGRVERDPVTGEVIRKRL